MSNIKIAVDAAIRALNEFYPDRVFVDLELEEVIPAEDGTYWLITLGYHVPVTNPVTGLAAAIAIQKQYERKYKVLKVDASSYQVQAMRIRSLNSESTDNS